ncbi:MAG: hypothetical protein K9H58_08125 [Bacteroidales bacterium]|nr:hypothetical protein [Bacteroidales bacterium]
MKIRSIYILFNICLSFFVIAQPPQAFKYQAVVRDSQGDILANESVSLRISLREGFPGGTIIFQETHSTTTNQFGIVNLQIGWGTWGGGYNFLAIDWSNSQKFLEVEIDLEGGGTYTSLGTSQLLSVPYAMYSGSSGDWVRDNANMYSSNTGNIGIGTVVPYNKLDVYTTSGSAVYGHSPDSYAVAGKSDGSGVAGILGRGDASDGWGVYGYCPNGGTAIRGYSNGGWAGFFNGDTYVAGNLGLGVWSPSNRLEVSGSVLIGDAIFGGIKMRTDGTMVDIESLGDDLAINYQTGRNTVLNVTSGEVGIGTSTPNAKLHVNDRIRIGEDPSYSTVYGELIHEGGGTGFKINAHAGGGSWADMYLQTNGTTKLFIESSGKVGIGTESPIRKLQVNSEGSLDAIQGWSPDGTGVYAVSASSYGIFGQSSSYYAGYFSGPVNVTGSLSKGSGSFVIDHPLDPENKLLRHNFVESPENLLIYRGKVKINSGGETTVDMPEYFKALTKEDEASIHLTCIGKPFLTGAEWTRDFSGIIIYGEPNREVFWEVLADRDDPVIHELGRPVEEEKGGEKSLCEKGKLLYPEAYGYPESMGRDYEIKQSFKK